MSTDLLLIERMFAHAEANSDMKKAIKGALADYAALESALATERLQHATFRAEAERQQAEFEALANSAILERDALADAMKKIADCPAILCRDCNWAGHEDHVVEGAADLCPRCNSLHLIDFEAWEYATTALAAYRQATKSPDAERQ